MRSPQAKAFDLANEPSAAKAKYGSGKFADGVLMARRLVEIGVPFVEVSLGGWDTHQDNFAKVKALSTQVDKAMSALINDLKERGLLDSTLVVWMGEFGRTPNINTRGAKPGRDHYPKAWSLAMFGGGLRGGNVVGKTDAEGAKVDRAPGDAGRLLRHGVRTGRRRPHQAVGDADRPADPHRRQAEAVHEGSGLTPSGLPGLQG